MKQTTNRRNKRI